ncbi:hypothetical protein [Actinoplanes regularis]|uniref:DUF5129 domain-containing protein n=1 Tax=Actinoplanes regularis TaxID=52697 RepID=A0A239HYI7_9ACTN|nr:hypothetical protein [Actinoplanes regularis]GIE91292.1 hypothetical protein Are01nite_77720 [Actinoplanes regularis]SNS86546.1 hypothetical protein SAMN06264365_126103 [Actinoplanes regularis]
MHRLWRAATVAALLLITMPAAASAESSDVEFADSAPVAIPVGKPAPVTLVNNNTTVRYEVTVTATRTDGTSVAPPATVDLAAGGVATVTVPALNPAGTEGFLVAVARAAGVAPVVARRPFRVSAAPAWKPSVADWRITSYRGAVLHGPYNATVPLAKDTSCGDAAVVVVGAVARPAGGTATVTATCRPGMTSVDLSLRGLGAAGDYAGKIDLAPDADGGELALTVRHTDDVVYPALLLLAGIALALVASWQSGRLTTLSRAREETFLVEADAAAAHQRFRAAAEGRSWRAYSFMASLQGRLEAVRRELRGLRWLVSEIDVDKGRYKELLDVLAEQRDLVDAWEPFAARLAALASARDAVTGESGIAAHADELLHGRELPSTGEVRPLVEEAERTESALLTWAADDRTVRSLLDLGVRLDGAVPAGRGQERLGRAVAAVRRISDDMRGAKDGPAYAELQVGPRLDEPGTELIALRQTYLGVLGGQSTVPDNGRAGPPARTADAPHTWDEVRETATAMARRAALSRRLRNALAFAAIGAVTVWTGLAALYFDRPFGTWQDYSAVLVWGFGTQTAIAVLAGALDRIIVGGSVVRA